MKIGLWILSWAIFAVAVVYWDVNRQKDDEPLSECHDAPIKVYHDRPMCMECKLYCEVK